VRPIGTILGRRTNGIGWVKSDPRLIVSAENDGGSLTLDGILWTPTSSVDLTLGVFSPNPPLVSEQRLLSGLTTPWQGQFVAPAAGNGPQRLVVTGFQYGQGWTFRAHELIYNPNLTSVAVQLLRSLGETLDRWQRTGRSGYSCRK